MIGIECNGADGHDLARCDSECGPCDRGDTPRCADCGASV